VWWCIMMVAAARHAPPSPTFGETPRVDPRADEIYPLPPNRGRFSVFRLFPTLPRLLLLASAKRPKHGCRSRWYLSWCMKQYCCPISHRYNDTPPPPGVGFLYRGAQLRPTARRLSAHARQRRVRPTAGRRSARKGRCTTCSRTGNHLSRREWPPPGGYCPGS
jgi:hypothetical protein